MIFNRRLAMAAGLAVLLGSQAAMAEEKPVMEPSAKFSFEVDADAVPEKKKATPRLYLNAREVPAFIEHHGGSQKALFLDIRTRSEAMYLGMAASVDALVPYMEHAELFSDWDDKLGVYKLESNSNFVSAVAKRLEEKGLTKDDIVVLMCRSGDRSAKAANLLHQMGYTKVWSVVDGFEGDMSKEGRRSVNGWKNANLPWTYKLDKRKMYFEG